nr:uncharacterized protein LOC129381151 [Dermacentor andersoni]
MAVSLCGVANGPNIEGDFMLAGLRSVHRPTSFRSGCPGATRTAAGLLATSSSAIASMTSCWAALWDQQEQQVATPASCRACGSVPGPAATLCYGEAAETARRLRIARSSTTSVIEEVMYVARPAGLLPFGDAAVAARRRRIARSCSATSSAHFAKCITCCSCCASRDPALPKEVTWTSVSLERVRARGQDVHVNAFGFVIRHFLFFYFF